MLCKVRRCCFIIDLWRGTIIVAIFSLLGNVGVLAYISWIMHQQLTAIQHNPKPVDQSRTMMYQVIILINTKVCVMLGILLFAIVVAIVMDVVLLFGAIKRRRDLLQSWLRVHPVIFGCYLFAFVQTTIELFIYGLNLQAALTLVAVILAGVVSVYLWIIVHSYDIQLRPNTSMAMSSTHTNFPASRQNGPDVEACPMVVSYSQTQVD